MLARRAFVGGALVAALATRAAAAPLPGRPVRLGIPLFSDPAMRAVRQALRELGYVERQNLVIEYRSAEGTWSASATSRWTSCAPGRT